MASDQADERPTPPLLRRFVGRVTRRAGNSAEHGHRGGHRGGPRRLTQPLAGHAELAPGMEFGHGSADEILAKAVRTTQADSGARHQDVMSTSWMTMQSLCWEYSETRNSRNDLTGPRRPQL